MSAHDLNGPKTQEQSDDWPVTTDALTDGERKADLRLSAEDASRGPGKPGAQRGSGRPFTSEAGKKAAEKSVAVRRARAAERELEAASDREKIARALGRVSQTQWDALVTQTFADATTGRDGATRRGSVLALTRLLDQAYGRAQPEAPKDDVGAMGSDGTGTLTREEKEALLRRLDAALAEDASSPE